MGIFQIKLITGSYNGFTENKSCPFHILCNRVPKLVKNNLHRVDENYREKYEHFFYDSQGQLEAG